MCSEFLSVFNKNLKFQALFDTFYVKNLIYQSHSIIRKVLIISRWSWHLGPDLWIINHIYFCRSRFKKAKMLQLQWIQIISPILLFNLVKKKNYPNNMSRKSKYKFVIDLFITFKYNYLTGFALIRHFLSRTFTE